MGPEVIVDAVKDEVKAELNIWRGSEDVGILLDKVNILLDEIGREGGGVGDGGAVTRGVEVGEFRSGPIGVVEKVKFGMIWSDKGDGRLLGHSLVSSNLSPCEIGSRRNKIDVSSVLNGQVDVEMCIFRFLKFSPKVMGCLNYAVSRDGTKSQQMTKTISSDESKVV